MSVVEFESTYFFSVPKGLFFFIQSLLVYKFQGRQPFRTFKLNIFFFKQCSFNTFLHQQITRFEKQNLLKNVFLLNFICINIELQNNINRINANESTIPEKYRGQYNKIMNGRKIYNLQYYQFFIHGMILREQAWHVQSSVIL